MEIKSNNVLIGAFALAGIAAIFLFALWIGRFQLDRTYEYYEIVFEGSVSGLTKSGTVQYNGIQVGQVVDLRLARNDPSKVVALVELDARTPVKEDTEARLELFGLTGVALIELSGGSAGSPSLEAQGGQDYPVIKAEKSTIQQLFTSAPEAVDNANQLIHDLRVLVQRNDQNVTGIMTNLNTVSEKLAASSDALEETLENVNKISGNVESITAGADDILQKDVKRFVADARATANSYRQLGQQFESIVEGNRASIDRFAREGLGEMPLLIAEMRELVRNLDRVVARAEDNPGAFLLGKDVPEYQGAE
ncbi:MlaD family protein [Tepidicaulis sp.]|uniref:MlaD family protein n=1 Tax=Tepidicaulis sp. TaxID=1920809 RepID=UPI003B59103B